MAWVCSGGSGTGLLGRACAEVVCMNQDYEQKAERQLSECHHVISTCKPQGLGCTSSVERALAQHT